MPSETPNQWSYRRVRFLKHLKRLQQAEQEAVRLYTLNPSQKIDLTECLAARHELEHFVMGPKPKREAT